MPFNSKEDNKRGYTGDGSDNKLEELDQYSGVEELPGDPEDDEEELTPDRRISLTVKIVAFFTALIFIFVILANVLHFFTLPSLAFLQESRDLESDPALQELQQAVVQVLHVSSDGPAAPAAQRKGTGFNIHPAGLIVTNKHVIEGADAVTVSFAEAGSFVVSHRVKSSDLDLALLYLEVNDNNNRNEISSAGLPYVELQLQHFPEVGEDVIIMGNPLGFSRVISRGNISAYRPYSGLPYPMLELEAPIHAGSSGSPVFDLDNKVVAVVYASLRHNGGNNEDGIKGLAIPVLFLQEMIEDDLQD